MFAEKASGDTYIVTNWNYQLVDTCRVRNHTEQPGLLAIFFFKFLIIVFYTNWANQKTICVRDDISFPSDKRDSNILKERSNEYCLDWDGYGDDPADPDGDPTLDIGYYPNYCGVTSPSTRNTKDHQPQRHLLALPITDSTSRSKTTKGRTLVA